MGKRMYSCYAKVNDRWARVSKLQFTLTGARRLFQNALLAGSFNGIEMSLRPVKPEGEQVDETFFDRLKESTHG